MEYYEEERTPNPIWRFIKAILPYIIIVAVLWCTFKVFNPVRVAGTSMEPSLHDNDLLINNTLQYKLFEPKRGEIIIIDSDYNGGETIVKRIIGVPGDLVEVRNNEVYVNNKKTNENFTKDKITLTRDKPIQTEIIPVDKYFVMGDNRQNSADSRLPEIGLIDKDDIKGKVVLRLWPIDKFKIMGEEKII